MQDQIIEKQIRFFTIDAYALAKQAGMGGRINTIMQTCFFGISGILPREEAVAHIKKFIEKTYGKRGTEVVRRNSELVDQALANLHEVKVPAKANATHVRPLVVSERTPFRAKVAAVMLAGKGDLLPVSAFPVVALGRLGRPSGRSATSPLRSRSGIRRFAFSVTSARSRVRMPRFGPRSMTRGHSPTDRPRSNPSPTEGKEYKGWQYTIQVAPEDCTGCNLCVNVCPAKDRTNPKHKAINMAPKAPLVEAERANYDFFLELPELQRAEVVRLDHKASQFLEPLFEYSGACAGCGETPYLKLLTQLFGDRLLIANATGCSSIYGGNLPTTPYTTNREGRGPAWANSLFEDNAEFGFGFRLALDAQTAAARRLVKLLAPQVGGVLATELLGADQRSEAGIRGSA